MNTLPASESAIERAASVDTWDDLINLLLAIRETNDYTANWVINQIKTVGMPPLQCWRKLMIEFNYCFYWPNLMWVASRQTDRPDLFTVRSLRIFRKAPPVVMVAEVTEVLETVEVLEAVEVSEAAEDPSPKIVTPANRTKGSGNQGNNVRRKYKSKKAPLPPGAPYDAPPLNKRRKSA